METSFAITSTTTYDSGMKGESSDFLMTYCSNENFTYHYTERRYSDRVEIMKKIKFINDDEHHECCYDAIKSVDGNNESGGYDSFQIYEGKKEFSMVTLGGQFISVQITYINDWGDKLERKHYEREIKHHFKVNILLVPVGGKYAYY